MIEPIHSLAFSMQANRGVYAVLIGSGLSRSANILTGWEITLDLVRKVATTMQEDCGDDPIKWYHSKFDKAPDYSELLNTLGKTPSERQQLIRHYIEPTEQEREDGSKQPTEAHRAIADLAKRGVVRVIVTTNFDRLMEQALEDVGVTPTILSSPDHILGAMPLIHTNCCVFKVHGDYLDTRIRNTPAELETYPAEFNNLLDRILDEFGLIICGWSADWDVALKAAILRAPSRRFSTYWATRNTPNDIAKGLIEHRRANIISIQGADDFFSTLQRQIEALDEYSKPHPLTTAAAVASLKKYMSEPRFKIQHNDLIEDEVERVLAELNSENFAATNVLAPDAAQFNQRIQSYVAAVTTLSAMAFEAGFWADDSQQEVWVRALQKLSVRRSQHGGYELWLNIETFPGTLLLYSLCLGAISKNQFTFISSLLTANVIKNEYPKTETVSQILPAGSLKYSNYFKLLEGFKNHYVPLSDWIFNWLEPYFHRKFSSKESFTHAFDKLEVLMALSYGKNSKKEPIHYWAPVGAFCYRHDNCTNILDEINHSLDSKGDKSEYVQSRIFGNSKLECLDQLAMFKDFSIKVAQRW